MTRHSVPRPTVEMTYRVIPAEPRRTPLLARWWAALTRKNR